MAAAATPPALAAAALDLASSRCSTPFTPAGLCMTNRFSATGGETDDPLTVTASQTCPLPVYLLVSPACWTDVSITVAAYNRGLHTIEHVQGDAAPRPNVHLKADVGDNSTVHCHCPLRYQLPRCRLLEFWHGVHRNEAFQTHPSMKASVQRMEKKIMKCPMDSDIIFCSIIEVAAIGNICDCFVSTFKLNGCAQTA